MTKRLKAAVIGTGFIGPVHVEALRRASVEVLGVAGSTPAKSQRAAESLGLDRGYDSIEALLADPAVDVVHVTSPNQFHFAHAAAALQAGKHVMCEKPLAMNSAESSELVRLANSSGRAASVCYNIRFYPLCHEAAARVAQQEFGIVLHATGSYVQDWLLRADDFNWRVNAEAGGELRAVADIGTHWLDLIQFITGQRVVSVCADLQIVHATRQQPLGASSTFVGNAAKTETRAVPVTTEDAGSILLKFADGARGCLHVSQTTAGRKNCLRFEIAGESQTLAWNSEIPDSLWIGHREQANLQIIRDPALLAPSAAAISSYPGGHCEGFSDTFKQLFRAYYAGIESGDLSQNAAVPNFADGHAEILICEAILESHRQQRWIDVRQEKS